MHEPAIPPQPEQITTRLWRVGGESWNGTVNTVSAEGDANVYLLRGSGAHALIDCATHAGRPQIEANLRDVGVEPADLSELLLTHSHWDHTQAAHDWQTAYGLRTHLNAVGSEFLARGDHRLVGSALHGPEYAFTPFTVDHPVADGETFGVAGVSMTAHFLPGHTPDSTLYTFALDDTLVGVCGDIAFGRNELGTHSLGLLSNLWQSDLDLYVGSLRRLAQTPIDLLLPGHGARVAGRDAVRAAVEATLAVAERLAGDPQVRRNTGI
jgi:glyoxylase-like metal-dependent hydrolase (beta-lactamase superfamily II)